MARESDAEVIGASMSDPEHFAIIFERHHPAVYRYLKGRVGASRAPDLAAEAFVRAFQARKRYDGRESARGWLFGIATNLLREHWRRERRELRAYARTGQDPLWSDTEQVESRVEAVQAGPALALALISLPEVEREALLLSAWAELSNSEIARALDVPEATVRSRLFRARQNVREQIAPSGKVEVKPLLRKGDRRG
jgi:RNA polymerase sigma factor (sigma-70 family)